MNPVQVEQKSYQMPPQDGFTVAHFLTVADIERSVRFYEAVFGGRILSRGDSSGAPGYIQIANTWLIVNVGGGPTPDKPSVTLSVPADPDSVSSFMNIRVADTKRAMSCGEIGEPSSSRSRSPSTARRAATFAILMAILSKSGKASRASLTAERHDT
jgi:Glyoxalase/Bleomycin resistance protein/Dioxygenase superfamily